MAEGIDPTEQTPLIPKKGMMMMMPMIISTGRLQ